MAEYRQLQKCGHTHWSSWKFLHINLLDRWLYDSFYYAVNEVFVASMTHIIVHWDLWSSEVASPYKRNTASGADKVVTDEDEITTVNKRL